MELLAEAKHVANRSTRPGKAGLAVALGASLAMGCADTPGDDPSSDDPMGDPGQSGDPGEGQGSDPRPPGSVAFACPAGAPHLVNGLNTITVASQQRSFFADFPADTSSKPLGVVFSWHGFAQEAVDFRAQVALRPDADPEHPVVIVTPNDVGLLPPAGLDWNIVKGADNADLKLFEAALGCLNAQYSIDADAIYSFGFSAGSVMTSLVHASYPDLVRAVVAESGAWFDDPAEVALVHVPMPWDWPTLPMDSGSVLLTHGGPNDVTVLNILSLEDAAQAAFPFLAQHWRVVVDCKHDLGHALAPDVSADMIVQFLTSHHGDEPGTMTSFPASCAVRMP